jgi:FlaA1/EpsC-like NDP-sugar epimerase
VKEVLETYHAQVIFHEAAYKNVPLMENNSYEAFRTNVTGTKIVAEKAIQFGTERFVLVSTDKAVNPVSVMGMTKVAEEMIHHFSERRRKEDKIHCRPFRCPRKQWQRCPLFRSNQREDP